MYDNRRLIYIEPSTFNNYVYENGTIVSTDMGDIYDVVGFHDY